MLSKGSLEGKHRILGILAPFLWQEIHPMDHHRGEQLKQQVAEVQWERVNVKMYMSQVSGTNLARMFFCLLLVLTFWGREKDCRLQCHVWGVRHFSFHVTLLLFDTTCSSILNLRKWHGFSDCLIFPGGTSRPRFRQGPVCFRNFPFQ